jgi:Ion channel
MKLPGAQPEEIAGMVLFLCSDSASFAAGQVFTLSTVGYGDITPVSRIARWLAAMEAMTGLLYVAVLIARLVSLYSSPKSDDS